MDEQLWELALRTGLPVWLVGGAGGIYLVAQVFPRILGPVSQAIHDWTRTRRQAAVERDDADIAERDRLITHLDAVVKRNRTELAERDRLAWLHQRWDQARMAENPDADPPPPLFPSDRPA